MITTVTMTDHYIRVACKEYLERRGFPIELVECEVKDSVVIVTATARAGWAPKLRGSE